jgi:integrase
MAKDLTVKGLESIKPGAARREVPDGHTRGLYFIVQPTGAASWAFRYRFAGKPKKLSIGPYPAIDIKVARELAGDATKSVARGDDPAAQKQASKSAARAARERDLDVVEDLVDSFIERHAKKKTKPKSWMETKRILDREVVEAWRGRRLSTIGRAEVHKLLDRVGDRAPILANRVLAALRRMCSWAVERGLITTSPCEGVKAPSAERERERVLSHEEMRVAWAAFEEAAFPFGRLAQLLLLTGVRLREAAEARWSEIDLADKTWTIPKERSKNGNEHEIALSDAALRILESLPRIAGGKGYPGLVFSTNGRTAISGFSRAKEGFDAAIECGRDGDAPERWTFHDLRRSCATGMAELGIAPHVVEAALNHKSGTIKGVARIYNRHNYRDERRVALQAWGKRVEQILTGAPAGNVVELAATRG